jgi:hypothetical protein
MSTKQFCAQNYGTESRIAEVQAIVEKGILRPKGRKIISPGSLISVIRRPDRFTLPHGMSSDEIRLAAQSGKILDRLGLPLFYAVVSNRFLSEREVRELARTFKKEIVREQRKAGVPALWLEMQEGEPAWHTNILFPLNGAKAKQRVEALMRSSTFPDDTLKVQEAQGGDWFVAYHAKLRAPQARYIPGVKMAARQKGSHPNGEGGGDNVRVSEEFRSWLLAGGISRWKRSNASRALPKQQAEVDTPTPVYVEPVQLALPIAAPVIDIRSAVEAKRLAIGMSQQALAATLGLKQPGYSNAFVRRHDRPGPWLINRAVEFIGSAAA